MPKLLAVCPDAGIMRTLLYGFDGMELEIFRESAFQDGLEVMEEKKPDMVLLQMHCDEKSAMPLVERMEELKVPCVVVLCHHGLNPPLAETPERLVLNWVDANLIDRIEDAAKKFLKAA